MNSHNADSTWAPHVPLTGTVVRTRGLLHTQERLPNLGSGNTHREVTSGSTKHSNSQDARWLPRGTSLFRRSCRGTQLAGRAHPPLLEGVSLAAHIAHLRCKEAHPGGRPGCSGPTGCPSCVLGQLQWQCLRAPRKRRQFPESLRGFPVQAQLPEKASFRS